MKGLSSFSNIYIHRESVDMRCGIRGLSEIVQMSGKGLFQEESLFVFSGRRKNNLKILYYDRNGFALWQKRLEHNSFPWPRKETQEVVEISSEQLSWLLEGIDIWKLKRFPSFKFDKVC